jgi:DNA primase
MKKVRVQLDVPEARAKELEQLQETCGLATRKDLYEAALSLFEWAIEQVKKDRLIGSKDSKGQFHEVMMPALSHVAKEK